MESYRWHPQRVELQNSLKGVNSLDLEAVTVSKSEYERLLRIASHFTKLKDSLLSGGLSPETLDILIYGSESSPAEATFSPYEQCPAPDSVHRDTPIKRLLRNKTTAGGHNENNNGTYHITHNLTDVDSESSEEQDECDTPSRSPESLPAPAVQRTILMSSLPENVTHQDIAGIVRGGTLLCIFILAREKSANVSFVEESAAQEFMQRARQHGIYLAGKRVECCWSHRQFFLQPYIRMKINMGATRNLVLYNVAPHITDWMIRRDLEHIHNLVVISVKFKKGNVYISTNSVHNALYARSCMMSRLTYKGMKIGFSPDECAEPLAKMSTNGKATSAAAAKRSGSAHNRFSLLSLDGHEDEEDDDLDELHGHSSPDGGVRWTEGSILA